MELRSCPMQSICDYVKEHQEKLPLHDILVLDEKGYHCGAIRRAGKRSNSCSYIETINRVYEMEKKPNGFKGLLRRFF